MHVSQAGQRIRFIGKQNKARQKPTPYPGFGGERR